MARKYLTQVGRPSVDRAFHGLRVVTRLYDVNAGGLDKTRIDEEVLRPYGTADEEFKSALLTKRQVDQSTIEKSGYELRLTEIYQEFKPGQKVSVEEDRVTRLPDGRTQLVRRYVCLAAEAETLAAAIGTVLSGRACANVEINDQGLGAEVLETYISAGKLAESDSTKNNGKLLLKSLTYFNQVPPTPGGYIVTDTQVRDTQGVPTYTYQFAQGSGEISRSIDYGQSKDLGTTGVTRTTIRHLTASTTPTDPTSLPGSVKISEDKSDNDGYRIWTVTYAKGTGKVAEQIDVRTDGLRMVTWTSLGTRLAPTGIVVRDDWREAEGYTVYTVGTMQTATGGASITSETFNYERYVNFTYPGRVKAFTELYDGKTMLDVFESPPVTTLVLATVTISYQTSNTIGSLGLNPLWNPTSWATVKAQWTGSYGKQTSQLYAMPGYRSVSSSPVTLGAGNTSVRGSVIYAGTTAKITVTGGPADPGGNSYTLHAELEPAFTASDGTKYYRKILITATIPAQAALPV